MLESSGSGAAAPFPVHFRTTSRSNHMKNWIKTVLFALSLAILSACGGGDPEPRHQSGVEKALAKIEASGKKLNRSTDADAHKYVAQVGNPDPRQLSPDTDGGWWTYFEDSPDHPGEVGAIVFLGVDKSCGDSSCWTSNGNFMAIEIREWGTYDDSVLVINVTGTGMPSGGYYAYIDEQMNVVFTRQYDGAVIGTFDMSEAAAEYFEWASNLPVDMGPLEPIPWDSQGNMVHNRYLAQHKLITVTGVRDPKRQVLYNGASTIVKIQSLLLKGGARTTPL
jgi:hypothetical protein